MAYGFKLKNENSELQIDDTYTNYVWNGQSGTLNISGLSDVALTNPSKYPPIALLQPDDAADRVCGVFSYTYSAPYYTHVRFYGGNQGAAQINPCNFHYKIYTLTDVKGTEAYGTRIRNPRGEISYDTGKIPFKILEVGTATMASTYTHADHASPYYIFSPWLSGLVIIPIPPQGRAYRMLGGLSKQSTTSVRGDWLGFFIGIGGMVGSEEYQGTTFTLIICDPGKI